MHTHGYTRHGYITSLHSTLVHTHTCKRIHPSHPSTHSFVRHIHSIHTATYIDSVHEVWRTRNELCCDVSAARLDRDLEQRAVVGVAVVDVCVVGEQQAHVPEESVADCEQERCLATLVDAQASDQAKSDRETQTERERGKDAKKSVRVVLVA